MVIILLNMISNMFVHTYLLLCAGKSKQAASETFTKEQDHKEKEVLLLQIEALQSQLEDQTKASKEQVEALLEDRRVRMEEMQTVIERDQHKIQMITEK